MRKRITVVAAFLLASVVAVAIGYASWNQKDGDQSDNRIKGLEEAKRKGQLSIRGAVELAKAKGEQRVLAPGLPTLYMGLADSSDELDEKLNDFTVVTAKLVDKESYMPDEAVIRTWNKFKVLETLSQGPAKPPYFPWPPVPDQLLPLKEDEILVHTHGGAVTVDGIEVVQHDTDVPSFQKSQKYLLVLSYDPSTKKGFLELGPQSLLRINDDNSLHEREDKYPLQQLVKERYGGDVSALKRKLMRQPHK